MAITDRALNVDRVKTLDVVTHGDPGDPSPSLRMTGCGTNHLPRKSLDRTTPTCVLREAQRPDALEGPVYSPKMSVPNRAQLPREPVRFDIAPSPTAITTRVEGAASDAEVAER